MTSIAAFGVGNTGCHGGRRFAVTGSPVVPSGSPQTGEVIATQGLDLSDYHGWTAHASPAHIASAPKHVQSQRRIWCQSR